MKVIAREVGTGKTKELLTDAYMNGAQVLTTNKRALQAKAQAYGLVGITIIDLEDFAYGEYASGKPLYIHKITDVIQEFLKYNYDIELEEMTVTIGE